MHVAVSGDQHAHAEALHAVLAAARESGAEQVWSRRDRIGRARRILRSRSR